MTQIAVGLLVDSTPLKKKKHTQRVIRSPHPSVYTYNLQLVLLANTCLGGAVKTTSSFHVLKLQPFAPCELFFNFLLVQGSWQYMALFH